MIGSDSTSVSYRIDEDKFIKDFSEFIPLELIKKERSNAQEAFINGINTTIPFNVVQTDYNYGIIYELMDYETIMDALKKNPNRLNELSQQFGKFMKETHSNEFENNTNFPSRKFHLIKFLNKYQEEIDSGKFYQLITLINSIPERNQFSHGNFQFSNVLLAEDTMFLIDMMHSGVGHPIFDIGSLYNSTILTNELLRKYPYARKMFISLGKNTNAEFFDKALKAYLNTDDEKKIDQVKKLAAIVGPLQFYEYYQTVFNTAFKNPLTKLLYNSILKFTKKKMIDGLKNIEKEEIDFNF